MIVGPDSQRLLRLSKAPGHSHHQARRHLLLMVKRYVASAADNVGGLELKRTEVHLIRLRWRLVELEHNVLVRQLLVHGRESIQLALSLGLALLAQVHLHQLAAISADASALAHDFTWVHYIIQNSLLHGSQSAGMWAHAVGTAVACVGLAEHSALADEDNVQAVVTRSM